MKIGKLRTKVHVDVSTKGNYTNKIYSIYDFPKALENLGKEISTAIDKAIKKISEDAVEEYARLEEKNLKEVIATHVFYGWQPMMFSGRLWLDTVATKVSDIEWNVSTNDYGYKLIDGLPPGTIVPKTDYTLRYADLKFKTPFNVMAERILKSGTRPRDWVVIGDTQTFYDFVNEVDNIIEKNMDKELNKIKLR